MTRGFLAIAVIALLSACPPPVVTPDGGTRRPDAGVRDVPDAGDPLATLFAPNKVLDVRIELPAANWELLRNQTRDLFTLLTGDCTAQPFPSPFTEFESTVTVDGVRFERVSIKKKGFLGSLSANRPSLKLKFDEFINDQLVQGSDTLTLNNTQQDPSIIRTCLGYSLFAKAGLLAPRCNFAHVFVNGTDLGVYANVEGIDKDFLRRRFEKAGGNLYEGTLSDFNATYLNTFDLKGNNTDRSDLQAVVTTLAGSDAELMARLDPLIDTTQFIDFWAMETLVRHWDGYAGNTNNFFLYDDPTTDKFVFIAWGADAVFFNGSPTEDTPDGPMLRGELAQRLYGIPAVRARYLARVQSLLNTVFVESELRSEVARMQALVTPLAHPIQASQLAMGLADVRAFIEGRRAKLTQLLATPPPVPTRERPSPCLKRLGTFNSTFATTWGTLGAMDPFATGPATFTLVLDGGAPDDFVVSGASAGLDTEGNDGPRVGINLVGAQRDGGFTAAVVRINPVLYPPAAGAQPFDLFARVGYVFRYSGGAIAPIGLLSGTFSLSDAGVVDGGAVAGVVNAEVLSWPFGGGM